jgi:hypothetical protein
MQLLNWLRPLTSRGSRPRPRPAPRRVGFRSPGARSARLGS